MDFSINDQKIEIKEGLNKFQELIQWVEQELLQEDGKVLTQIKVNGTEIDEYTEEEIKEAPLSSIDSVEVQAETPQNLVLQGLLDADSMLPEILSNLDVCIEKVQNQEKEEAVAAFVKVTDGLSWFSTIYSGAASVFQEKIVALQLDTHEFVLNSSRLNEILNDILDAYNSQDNVAFADLLEFELKEILESLRDCVKDFREKLSTVQ